MSAFFRINQEFGFGLNGKLTAHLRINQKFVTVSNWPTSANFQINQGFQMDFKCPNVWTLPNKPGIWIGFKSDINDRFPIRHSALRDNKRRLKTLPLQPFRAVLQEINFHLSKYSLNQGEPLKHALECMHQIKKGHCWIDITSGC